MLNEVLKMNGKTILITMPKAYSLRTTRAVFQELKSRAQEPIQPHKGQKEAWSIIEESTTALTAASTDT